MDRSITYDVDFQPQDGQCELQIKLVAGPTYGQMLFGGFRSVRPPRTQELLTRA